MDAGTEARRKFGDDALARIAISKINSVRAEDQPRLATAYVIHQLKHPAEVDLLRQVYGPGFFLIGVFEGEDAREERLHGTLRIDEDDARKLIEKDRDEAGKDHGQKSSKTFQRADVFVHSKSNLRGEVQRFVDLVFGDPFTTPSRDEYAMFTAYAASLRSAELGRQVGAAVFSKSRELLAIGANEVPAPGGGLYWPPPDVPEDLPHPIDGRDFALLKHDSNHHRRLQLVEQILSTLGVPGDDPRRKDIDRLVSNLTEYGRAVHAELEALLACSRVGVSVRGGTLFTTTFPCHNCVRHIVASGVHRVVFVEPYPKSLATELHHDAIVLASPGDARPRRTSGIHTCSSNPSSVWAHGGTRTCSRHPSAPATKSSGKPRRRGERCLHELPGRRAWSGRGRPCRAFRCLQRTTSTVKPRRWERERSRSPTC